MTTRISNPRIIIILTIILGIIVWSFFHHRNNVRETSQVHLPAVSQTGVQTESTSTDANAPQPITVKIKHKETATRLLRRLGVSTTEIKLLLKNRSAKNALSQLKQNDTILITLDNDKKIIGISYQLSLREKVVISRNNDEFTTSINEVPVDVRIAYKYGTIHHSFSQALNDAGVTQKMRSEFSNALHNQINIAKDAYPGDHFALVYDEYYSDGKKDHPGDVVAAEFVDKGKSYRAFRFSYPKNHTDYYLRDGEGLKPLFLNAPLHYKYVSSSFTYNRLDPVLHEVRPHLGVDFAANYGTPIVSIGNGRVMFAGRDAGYGNAAIINYGAHYKALYGHMEKFARNLHAGEQVIQGQIIGYIGSSGWSTGPHLHFGFFFNGKPENFLSAHFIGGNPIPKRYQADFRELTHTLDHALDLIDREHFGKTADAKVNTMPDLSTPQKTTHIKKTTHVTKSTHHKRKTNKQKRRKHHQ